MLSNDYLCLFFYVFICVFILCVYLYYLCLFIYVFRILTKQFKQNELTTDIKLPVLHPTQFDKIIFSDILMKL